jgi:hypothetical protein
MGNGVRANKDNPSRKTKGMQFQKKKYKRDRSRSKAKYCVLTIHVSMSVE